jgi:hypothetical protein
VRVDQESDDIDARLHSSFKSLKVGRLHPATAAIIIASGIVGWLVVIVLEAAR